MTNILGQSKSVGEIRGTISDYYGMLLPGVLVILYGPKIKGKLTVVTSERGLFIFRSIPPGIYNIKAELKGFKTFFKKDITVGPEETKIVAFVFRALQVVHECINVVVPDREDIEFPTIENKLDDLIDKISVGKILFNPPKEMKVSIKERIEVRISQNIKEDLTKKLKGRGVPQVEKIFVSSVMKVKLSGDTFKIDSLSEEQQIISSAGYTQWEWDITPLKSGNRFIHLSIAVSIYLDKYGEKIKSLPVMEKEIYIKVNLRYNFLNFLKKYWRWIIMTTIALIGLLLAIKGK